MSFSLLSDQDIADIIDRHPILDPYTEKLRNSGLSSGQGGHTYDVKLSPIEFVVLKRRFPWNILRRFLPIDPKYFFPEFECRHLKLNRDDTGEFFVMPPRSIGLGVTVERFNMPNDVMCIVLGKSTYARVGLICNTTPVDAGFEGYVTLEFINPAPYPVKIYANEGVAQLIFLRGREALHPYDKTRKYQNQIGSVVYSKVLPNNI